MVAARYQYLNKNCSEFKKIHQPRQRDYFLDRMTDIVCENKDHLFFGGGLVGQLYGIFNFLSIALNMTKKLGIKF